MPDPRIAARRPHDTRPCPGPTLDHGPRRLRPRAALVALAGLGLVLTAAGAVGASGGWGAAGHTMIGRAAAAGLPADMPAFFRSATDQLTYLNAEPDRWRSRESTVMDEAWKYDHYIDLENVPVGALDAPDRFEYLEALYAAGLREPEQAAGFLPYRILELQARLTSGFRRWRAASSAAERGWIEQRILNDAGILGHYVADAAQPHHTTIHFNGWSDDAPNPRGYTTDRQFHARFESRFVDAHIQPRDVMAAVPRGARSIDDVRSFVIGYIRDSHAHVVPLYELEKRHGFGTRDAAPAARDFAIERLATAAITLRALWYTAWLDSAGGS